MKVFECLLGWEVDQDLQSIEAFWELLRVTVICGGEITEAFGTIFLLGLLLAGSLKEKKKGGGRKQASRPVDIQCLQFLIFFHRDG